MGLKINTAYAIGPFIAPTEMDYIQYQLEAADDLLRSYTGPGHEYLGWLDITQCVSGEEIERIKKLAADIQQQSDVLIVIGVGGSYIGSRAAIEFLNHSFHNQCGPQQDDHLEVYFAGHHLSASYLNDLLEYIEGKDFSINIISKSGTTLEPSIAYRLFKQRLFDQYGEEEGRRRIYITTDAKNGALRQEADQHQMTSLSIPADVGGRFTVLTAVGLLPIAALGHDIERLLEGATDYAEEYRKADFEHNSAMQYAAIRNILYRKGYDIELLINYEPKLKAFSEWWQQLFGESEGKDQMGIYPAMANFTTDLHALGQYIQDGRRQLFETVLKIEQAEADIHLPPSDNEQDSMAFLDGESLNTINHKALEGTMVAHVEGGVPNILLSIDRADEYHLGQLFFFFELAVALSGYVNAVNPFDQPGVEAYKNNMFALLNKPGYEELAKELKNKMIHKE